jgi:hypothetical protein
MEPGNSLLIIQFNRDLQGQTAVRIYNISGQLVHQSALESIVANTPNQIQTSDLTSGYYVIHVQSGTMNFSQSVMIQ